MHRSIPICIRALTARELDNEVRSPRITVHQTPDHQAGIVASAFEACEDDGIGKDRLSRDAERLPDCGANFKSRDGLPPVNYAGSLRWPVDMAVSLLRSI